MSSENYRYKLMCSTTAFSFISCGMHRALLSISVFLISCLTVFSQSNYFPPVPANGTWEATSPESLGWCMDEVDSLYQFLDDKNTKGFIVLKGGKIVLEQYFDDFTQDSIWYWASAGKTITAFLVGKALEQGHLNLEDKTSDHLGVGWTNCSTAQEDKITIWHQLSMTTGLDDGTGDVDCTLDTCLVYKADAGDRWAYHNAPYTLLEKVVENATSTNYNTYTSTELKNKIGMNGLWIKLNYNNVYFSNARSMARYGHMMLNQCVWDGDTILNHPQYVNDMVNSSQSLNESYGYLWWLNGKSSYMLPGWQFVFNGSYAKDAPDDMYAGIGKNGQIVGVVPSQDLVVVRMGDPPSALSLVPVTFYNDIWKYLNRIMCNTSGLESLQIQRPRIHPNPILESKILHLSELGDCESISLFNPIGESVKTIELQGRMELKLDMNSFNAGLYTLVFHTSEGYIISKLMLQ